MCFGSKWMLMWRSGPCCSSAMVGPSIAAVRITVVAVGKLRPPFVDDVAHYTKMLAGHARMELIEVREDERAERRVAADGVELDSVAFARFIEQRRMSRRDLCFVIGGPFGLELERADHRLSLGP